MTKLEKPKPSLWTKIPDALVRHVWRCPKCKAAESCGPSDYVAMGMGTPMRSDCGADAEFVKTEVDWHQLQVLMRRRKSARARRMRWGD